MNVPEIGQAGPADHEDIRQLYAQAGYGAAMALADMVLVARFGGELAGVVRLCPEEGVTVLRGMQVKPAYQGRGIGRALLAACGPELDRGPAFCLPYTHLADFYGEAGFLIADVDQLPAFLAQRLAAYLDKGQPVLAMRRPR